MGKSQVMMSEKRDADSKYEELRSVATELATRVGEKDASLWTVLNSDLEGAAVALKTARVTEAEAARTSHDASLRAQAARNGPEGADAAQRRLDALADEYDQQRPYFGALQALLCDNK